MRTRFMLLASVLLSGTMLFSCTEEIENPIEGPEENPVENTELHEYTVTAFSEDSGTKAELGTDNYIFWQEGDKINLISTDDAKNNYCFTLSDGAGTAEGVFTGEVENPGADYVGIYPYNENNTFSILGGSLNWGKYKQIAIDGGFDPEACLMAGMTDSEGNVRFKNLCSYIKFTTDFDCKSIVLTCLGKDQCFVSPKIMFSLEENGMPKDGDIMPIHYSDNMELLPTIPTLTLVGQDGGIIPAGTYYVAVLPTTYDGISFTFTTKFDKPVVKATKKTNSNPDKYAPITISRNVIANVGSFLIDDLLPSGSNDFYGSGTESDPYLIHSLDDLKTLESIFSEKDARSKYVGAHFLQTKDIDCNGEEISIGRMRTINDYDAPDYFAFNGVYDGGEYMISNYKLKPLFKSPIGNFAGLFNNVTSGTIKNLTVKPALTNGCVINSTFNDPLYAGALIGYSGTSNSNSESPKVYVYNCHLAEGNYSVQNNGSGLVTFGGLIGLNEGRLDMRYCSNEANIAIGEGIIGGLIGSYGRDPEDLMENNTSFHNYEKELIIDRCRNNGNVSSYGENSSSYAGGFVGMILCKQLEFKVSNCVNSEEINTYNAGAFSGGFFGFLCKMTHTSYLHNCLNKGKIIAEGSQVSYAGGFVGLSVEGNYVSNGSDYSKHVYAALCVNVGNISGNYEAAFCASYLGLECFSCLWLDEHSWNESPRVDAKIPYNFGLQKVMDERLDDYYYRTVDTSTILDLYDIMVDSKNNAVRYCWYKNPEGTQDFQLQWRDENQWHNWAVAWKGSATWGEQNPTLDLDFNTLIDLPIAN